MSFWDGRQWIAEPRASPPLDAPRRLRDWLATGVIVAVAFVLVLPFTGTKASGAMLSATPSHGLAGSRVTLVGQGLPPRTSVRILFDGTPVSASLKVNGGGRIRTSFTVPANIAGLYAITATAVTGTPAIVGTGALATTHFTVDPPSTEPVPVTLSPTATAEPVAVTPSPTATAVSVATSTPAASPQPTLAAPTPTSSATTPAASPTPAVTPTLSPQPTSSATAPTSPTGQPGRITVCGRALCLAGQPWYMHGASVLGGMDDTAATAARATSAGLNTIRAVNFLDEQAVPAIGAYDEWRWQRLDRLIASAGSNGLKVILDLSTYRNMLANAGLNPYTHDWKAFVSFAANRRNTVTSVRYGDDPTIALVAIAGEVEPINTPDNQLGVTTVQVTEFFKRTFAQWRAVDPVHPVSSGGLLHYGWNSGIDWRAIFAAADVCSIHNYSAGDVAATPAIATYCAGINKPWITEEFGWEIGVGDANRAISFQSMYELNRANGSAGVAFWNLGPQTRTPTYDVNEATPLTLAVVRHNAQ